MKFWLLVVLAALVAVPLVAAGIGLLLPRNHVAAVTIDLAASPGQIWTLISDFPGTASWRPGVKAAALDASVAGKVRFTESSSQGTVSFEVVSQDAPRAQVVRVIDDDQPFGGTWTWTLEPNGTGTRLTIVEAGFVKNPIFRTMGALFFSPSATIEEYLRDLARKLGETAVPLRVERQAPGQP